MGKTNLTFPIKTSDSESTSFEITVKRYTSGYQAQISNAATRTVRQGYPIRIKENDLYITVQCRSIAEYDEIRKAMAITQTLMLQDVNRGFVRFSYPDLDLDYLGFIGQLQGGITRFVQAPELPFVFSLFKDTINTVTEAYSTANGTWRDIAGEDLVTTDIFSIDAVLRDSQPSQTRGRAVGTTGPLGNAAQ